MSWGDIYIYNQRVGLFTLRWNIKHWEIPMAKRPSHGRQATLHILNLREVQCHGATHHSLIHVFIWKIHLNLCVSWASWYCGGTAFRSHGKTNSRHLQDIPKPHQKSSARASG